MVSKGADRAEWSLMVGQGLANTRVTDREKLGGGETPQVGPRANAAHADHRGQHTQQVDREERQRVALFVLQLRQDVVAEVDEDDGEHPEGDAADDMVRDLEAVRQQRAERDHEVAEEEHEADIPPLIRGAVVVYLAEVVPE